MSLSFPCRWAAALLLALPLSAGAAGDYPSQAVRMIVPYAPGGASDVLARLLAAAPEGGLGQQIVVENRGGGASVAGTNAVASAQPNGYTVGLVDSAFTINPALLGKQLPYDSRADFRPVILAATSPIVLVVNAGLPARSVPELVALAKARPGQLNFGSAGNGSALHLAGEQFKLVTGTDMVHVPYKGGAPSIAATVGGETQLAFSAPSTVLAHIQTGRLRALAVTGPARIDTLPDVPTFAELGMARMDGQISFGVIAPKGTPDAAVERLAAAFNARLASRATAGRIAALGFEAGGGTPAQYGEFLDKQMAGWAAVVRDARLGPDGGAKP